MQLINNNDNNEHEDNLPSAEPEEYLSNAKYLVELIQQDLNFGRKETVPARLKRAIEDLLNLQKYFKEPELEITEEIARGYYLKQGYSESLPESVGLYRVATKGDNYNIGYVAVTTNDYRDFQIHDDFGVLDARNYAEQRGGSAAFWLRVG